MSLSIKQNMYVQYQYLWNQFIDKMMNQNIFDETIINTFINRNSALIHLNSNQAIIGTDNDVTFSILNDKKDSLESLLQSLTQSSLILNIYNRDQYQQFINQPNFQPTVESSTQETIQFGSKIPSHYTFENFVVGDCNNESYSACLACAYKPGSFHNPLFIYGNSGLGKTHLLCSVGNYVIEKYPDKKVCYFQTIDFVEMVSKSIKNGNIDQFKQQLKAYDILLMDDIQFLANKEKSHEIFFNVYNELINNNKQIIVASDRLPNEIKGIEERLISRFKQGLTVGIDSPEFDTSVRILKKKLDTNKEFCNDIDDDSLAFLATNFNTDVRSLEGSLKRLQFCIIQFNPSIPVDVKFTMSCFKGQVITNDISGLTPKKIINCVADYYNLTRQQITSRTRTKDISFARQVSMYLIRQLLDLPYIQIGAEFGGKDHSTVMTSCVRIEKLMKNDENFKKDINGLISQLSPKKL